MIQFERFAFDYVALCDQNKNIISVLLLLVVVKSRGFWENSLCHNFSNIHPPFLLETTSTYFIEKFFTKKKITNFSVNEYGLHIRNWVL